MPSTLVFCTVCTAVCEIRTDQLELREVARREPVKVWTAAYCSGCGSSLSLELEDGSERAG